MDDRATYNAHYIPNSHLDREWTMDFQRSRELTVRFIDSLLDIMDKVPEYEFLMDSQTVPLEDYLEVRPEAKSRLENLVRARRLHVGPWYSAPDMNTISGESITRNLLTGHRMAEQFGHVMKVGYTPFGFVHISQLPQIYAGFGIDTCLFYRGINQKLAPRSEFVWEGPDGTRVLASRMSSQPRYNYYLNVWRKGLYSDQPARLDRRYDWRSGQLPFRICDERTRFEHGVVLKPRRSLDRDVVRRELRALFEREKNTFRTTELAFMHGFDTSAPELLEDEVLRVCQQLTGEGESLFYSSLPRYVESLKAALADVELPVLTGEMKHPDVFECGFLQQYANVVSTRPRQKLRTAEVENLLTRSAEPFAAVAHILGRDWPQPYLDLAWRQFLKCHAHDTVGGCCIDRIEEDVYYRLADTESIAKLVLTSGLGAIVSDVDTSGLGREDVLITLFNPSPFARSEVVTCYVDVPRELKIDEFVITDPDGGAVEFTAKATGKRGKVYRDPRDIALFSDCDEYEVRIDAAELPGLGYATYVLRGGSPVRGGASLVAGTSAMANEFLEVEILPNGSLTVRNRETGRLFAGLHVFEDVGEAGHPWMHIDPKRDVRVTSDSATAEVALVSDTPLVASYEVKIALMIPETTQYDLLEDPAAFWDVDSRRGEPLVPLRITSIVSLAKGARSVDVVTTVDNQSTNHRLRVLFPTGLETDQTHAEIPYEVITRPITRDESHPLYGLTHIGYPFLKFVDMHDGTDGFAFVGLGIREYESLDDEDRTLAVTLFRAVDNWLCTTSVWDLVPGDMMQVLGRSGYHYRLLFHAGAWEDARVCEEAEKLNFPICPCLSGVEPGRDGDVVRTARPGRDNSMARTTRPGGTLPLRHGFFEIEGAGIVLSGMKKAERSDATIVRVFNPTDRAVTGALKCFREIKTAEYVDMNEEKTSGDTFDRLSVAVLSESKGGEEADVTGGRVGLTLPPKKVKTLMLTFQEGRGEAR